MFASDVVLAVSGWYEAVYVRPNSPMAIVDGAFAIGGFIAFLGLLLRLAPCPTTSTSPKSRASGHATTRLSPTPKHFEYYGDVTTATAILSARGTSEL